MVDPYGAAHARCVPTRRLCTQYAPRRLVARVCENSSADYVGALGEKRSSQARPEHLVITWPLWPLQAGSTLLPFPSRRLTPTTSVRPLASLVVDTPGCNYTCGRNPKLDGAALTDSEADARSCRERARCTGGPTSDLLQAEHGEAFHRKDIGGTAVPVKPDQPNASRSTRPRILRRICECAR